MQTFNILFAKLLAILEAVTIVVNHTVGENICNGFEDTVQLSVHTDSLLTRS